MRGLPRDGRQTFSGRKVIEAVIFDLDGVLIDSEQAWNEARRQFVIESGGRWQDRAQEEMMGMSSVEWSSYLSDELGVPLPPRRISEQVVERLARRFRERLPLFQGAREAVERLAVRWPLGLASSSNRELIDLVLEISALAGHFRTTISSEEVARGKPAPDVYLEVARRLEAEPPRCAAIEDSHNGILSAAAAGMRVIAVPNRAFPPGEEALARTGRVLSSLHELTPEVVEPRTS
jgi:HAD superfamily hydrolase (TIGR01509 family)